MCFLCGWLVIFCWLGCWLDWFVVVVCWDWVRLFVNICSFWVWVSYIVVCWIVLVCYWLVWYCVLEYCLYVGLRLWIGMVFWIVFGNCCGFRIVDCWIGFVIWFGDCYGWLGIFVLVCLLVLDWVGWWWSILLAGLRWSVLLMDDWLGCLVLFCFFDSCLFVVVCWGRFWGCCYVVVWWSGRVRYWFLWFLYWWFSWRGCVLVWLCWFVDNCYLCLVYVALLACVYSFCWDFWSGCVYWVCWYCWRVSCWGSRVLLDDVLLFLVDCGSCLGYRGGWCFFYSCLFSSVFIFCFWRCWSDWFRILLWFFLAGVGFCWFVVVVLCGIVVLVCVVCVGVWFVVFFCWCCGWRRVGYSWWIIVLVLFVVLVVLLGVFVSYWVGGCVWDVVVGWCSVLCLCVLFVLDCWDVGYRWVGWVCVGCVFVLIVGYWWRLV